MMRRRRPLMRQEGGTTQGSRFNAPMIGNVSEAGRSSLSGMSIQDLLARLEAPTVPSRYAEGGRTYSDNDLVMIEELSPQDEMQAEYDAEIAGLGSGTGLGGFFQDLLYGGMDPEELSELDFTPEFMQDLPEVPEEVEIAMSIVGPGKGKGISSLIGKAGELKGLGKKLVDSMRDKPPALPSPKRGRDFEEEPMTGREFLGYKDAPRPPSPRDSEMKIMRDMLKNPKADNVFDKKMDSPKSQLDNLASRTSRSAGDDYAEKLMIKRDSLEGQLMQDRLEPRTRRRLESELRDVLRDINFFTRKARLQEPLGITPKSTFGPPKMAAGGRPGLYANIHAKRKRIAAGSGERMRKPGSKGAPTAANFKQAAKTAKRAGGGHLMNTGYYGKSYR